MNTPIEDQGYAYPDPATRRRAMVLAIFGGIFALVVGLELHSVVRAWLDRYFLELEKLARHDLLAVKRSLLNLMALIFGVSGTRALGFGIWIIRTGWQMTMAERWPRPGMKVYRRTKILDGKSARRRGTLLVALGLILAILVPAMGWKAYRSTSTFFDSAESCPPRRDGRRCDREPAGSDVPEVPRRDATSSRQEAAVRRAD